jgi:Cysteine dioxygenase type I
MTVAVLHQRTDLITTSPLSAAELSQMVARIAAEPEDWQTKLRFGAAQRWWRRLHGDDNLDVWLLTWVRDTGTDFHDHGVSAGAFTVVCGELEEVRLGASGSIVTTRLPAGASRGIEPGVVHDVRSPSVLPAVSIHAYSPPLREMTFYAAAAAGPVPTRTVHTRDEGTL